MRILGVSDTAESLIYSSVAKSLYSDVDLVISSGDLPLRYYDYIQTVLNRDVAWVYGNHNLDDYDRTNSRYSDSYKAFGDMVSGKPVEFMPHFGGIYLDGKVIYDEAHDIILAGLGGSMLYNGGKSQYSEKEMKSRIFRLSSKLYQMKRKHGRYLDILVTHAAPRGIGDGEDMCHMGFRCFLSFMDKFKPRYLLHGHVHLTDLNANRVTQYKDTKVINIYKSYILDDPELGRKDGRVFHK